VSSNPDATADPIPVAVRRILQIPPSDRTPAQQTALFRHWRSQQPEFAEVNARIEHLLQSWPEGTTTLTLIARTDSGPGDEIRTTHVFRRGDWLRPGREVSFGTPAVLHGLPDDADATRLTLARWLVDRQSPTTARVAVNRVWQQLFGIGLVETPEDFGLQSPAPSHPLLLDWLATEFMDHGWSTKQLLRLILTSATYQQASRLSPDHLEQDPYNRLLARAPRLRVEGEIVRDLALAAGGLLDPTLGGRSVYPPAPDFLFQPPASYGPKVWSEEPDSHRYRRSLYVFKFRSVPYPVLANFDAPTGDFACVRRPRSNTALQALTTLNEIQFVEAARALAHRTLAEAGPTDDDRLVFAFRQVLTRPPDAEELAEIRGLLNRQRQRLSDGWLIPRELIGNDTPSDLLPGISPTLLAAYTVVGRALLNLDEAITRE
jgi:hypothetical protein